MDGDAPAKERGFWDSFSDTLIGALNSNAASEYVKGLNNNNSNTSQGELQQQTTNAPAAWSGISGTNILYVVGAVASIVALVFMFKK